MSTASIGVQLGTEMGKIMCEMAREMQRLRSSRREHSGMLDQLFQQYEWLADQYASVENLQNAQRRRIAEDRDHMQHIDRVGSEIRAGVRSLRTRPSGARHEAAAGRDA